MNLIFGWHLDGPSFPEQLPTGTRAVGPSALLGELALRLGISAPLRNNALRTAEYLSRMKTLDSGAMFYSRSLRSDPWATARAVLCYRDDLVAAGWKPSARSHQGGGNRLPIIAELEGTSDDHRKLYGSADLQAAIMERFSTVKSPLRLPIARLAVLDETTILPASWRQLLSYIAETGAIVSSFAAMDEAETRLLTGVSGTGGGIGNNASKSDLRHLFQRLQQAHNNQLQTPHGNSISGDGSLLIARAENEVQAADFLVSWLSTRTSDEQSTVVLRGASTYFADGLLRKSGLPSLGGAGSSSLRAFLQLIPLAFELCWHPANPQLLMELLTLPHSPIPPYIASCFLTALQKQHGVSGDAWMEAWQTAFKRTEVCMVPVSAETAAAEQAAEDIANSMQRWRRWLESAEFDATPGLPIANAIAVCRRLKEHATKQAVVFESANYAVFTKAISYLDTLEQVFVYHAAECGPSHIPRAQLARIIDSVLGDGCRGDTTEASAWVPLDHPGQIFAPADALVWWNFSDAGLRPRPLLCSAEEQQFLEQNGIMMEAATNTMRREAAAFRRPLLCRQILFVQIGTAGGRALGVHPFFHEISESLKSPQQQELPEVLFFPIGQIYRLPSLPISNTILERQPVARQKLPTPGAIWSIGTNLIRERSESASSMERMLGCPLSWLLRYQAKLRPGVAATVHGSEQVAGNLAHAVLAKLFSQSGWQAFSPAQMKIAAEENFDQLCPEYAAPYLMPGKSFERQRLRKHISEAAHHLSELLSAAEISEITVENLIEAEIDGLQLNGRLDMLLTRSNRDFVLDFKWTGRAPHRRQEITEGRAIQLAVHAALRTQQTQRPSTAGYYLLAQKQLYTQDKEFFPGQPVLEGRSLADTFDEVVLNYKRNLRTIQDGSVAVRGICPPAPASETTLVIDPPCRVCDYGRVCSQRRVMHD